VIGQNHRRRTQEASPCKNDDVIFTDAGHKRILAMNSSLTSMQELAPSADVGIQQGMIQWSSLGSSGVPWDLVEFLGIQWSSLGSSEVPWDPVKFLGIQWSSLGSSGVPWDPVEYLGIQ